MRRRRSKFRDDSESTTKISSAHCTDDKHRSKWSASFLTGMITEIGTFIEHGGASSDAAGGALNIVVMASD